MSRCVKGSGARLALVAVVTFLGCGPPSPPPPQAEREPVVEQARKRVLAVANSERITAAVAESRAAAGNPRGLEVVKAVISVAPEAAPACARELIKAQPGRAGEYVFALLDAAPDYAPEVVSEACQAAPDQFAAVAMAAGLAAPLRSHSIVLALSEALPDLRDPLERAKTLVGKGRASHPSVMVLIQQTQELIEADHAVSEGSEQ